MSQIILNDMNYLFNNVVILNNKFEENKTKKSIRFKLNSIFYSFSILDI